MQLCHLQKDFRTLLRFFKKKWAIPGLFFIYFRLFNTVDNKQMFNKILPMTGVKPQTSGLKSDHSTNCATTTSPGLKFFGMGKYHLYRFQSSV